MNSSVSLFGMQINPLRMHDVIEQLLDWVKHPDGTCHYVVTPNVDHAVMFQKHEDLRRAYADAALVLADGFPVLVASRLLRRGIPERVPGSDLVPTLFETVNPVRCHWLCQCRRRWKAGSQQHWQSQWHPSRSRQD